MREGRVGSKDSPHQGLALISPRSQRSSMCFRNDSPAGKIQAGPGGPGSPGTWGGAWVLPLWRFQLMSGWWSCLEPHSRALSGGGHLLRPHAQPRECWEDVGLISEDPVNRGRRPPATLASFQVLPASLLLYRLLPPLGTWGLGPAGLCDTPPSGPASSTSTPEHELVSYLY